MNQKTPRRIVIIGLPGSGKSTLALELGNRLHIPVYHLDQHIFTPQGKKKSKQEIRATETALISESAWIIEGCSLSTLAIRVARADLVLYLRFSRWVCLWRIIKRMICFSPSLTQTGCTRSINLRLLQYIWSFEKEKGPQIEEIHNQYPQVPFQILQTSQDVKRYIQEMELKK